MGKNANPMPHCSCCIVDVDVTFRPHTLIRPLELSTGRIEKVTESRASVTVETREGKRATGSGAIYLSDLWAWPDPKVPHETRVSILTNISERVGAYLPSFAGGRCLHPLELGLGLHEWVQRELTVETEVPALARAMCASPFDAAIHDAVGIALARSAFEIYTENAAIPAADSYFPAVGVVSAIRRLIQPPRRELQAWFVVSKNDVLPDAMSIACQRHGYRCFKIKISGRNNAADAARTVEVFKAARQLGIECPQLTVDSNESNSDAASVLDFLDQLNSLDVAAYQSLAYLEQPTARDIVKTPFNWNTVAARKPVLLDEGLTDLSVLEIAKQQGWSGLALKTCKGHSMLLATAAWAHERGMLLSLQDLTNPGIALVHGALVASRLPTINGAELNSPQFTPAANEALLPQLRDLVEVRDGVHRLPLSTPVGLGSVWANPLGS